MSRHTFKEWVMATRPWSFPASAMPVVTTVAFLFMCGIHIDWLMAAGALVAIVIFHAGGNTWSDYHDYLGGIDTPESTAVTTLTSGQFKPTEIRNLGLGLITTATLLGLAMVARCGMPLLWVGIAGAMLTILYPMLKRHALGDLDIFLTYAFLPCIGTSIAVSGTIAWDVMYVALPLGLIIVAILHSNNLRDIETDGEAGITTFAMCAGHHASAWIYTMEMAIPFASVIMCVAAGIFPLWALMALLPMRGFLDNIHTVVRYGTKGEGSIQGVDENTAKLLLAFSLLLTVSFIISALTK